MFSNIILACTVVEMYRFLCMSCYVRKTIVKNVFKDQDGSNSYLNSLSEGSLYSKHIFTVLHKSPFLRASLNTVFISVLISCFFICLMFLGIFYVFSCLNNFKCLLKVVVETDKIIENQWQIFYKKCCIFYFAMFWQERFLEY